jgi:hypothetical protein
VTFALTCPALINPDMSPVVAYPVIVNWEAITVPSLYTLNGAVFFAAPAHITILFVSGTPIPAVYPVLFVVIVASDEFKDSVPAAVVLNIVDELTSHKPIKADCVVSFPVVASMVVIPEIDDELNVSPDEFNIYPAPFKAPPDFFVVIVTPLTTEVSTFSQVNAPEYTEAPDAS